MANDRVSDAVECIRLGASDFVTKPFEIERMRAIALRAQNRVALQERLNEILSNWRRKVVETPLMG